MSLRRRSFNLLTAFAAVPLRATAASSVSRSVAVQVLTAAAFELFPHDDLPRANYESLATAFVDADEERGLRFAVELGDESFVAAPRAERLQRITAVQNSPDFFALRMHVLMGLYNDLNVTRRFGYEGPSFAQGGYLERGFDDLRWLPEPRVNGD